MPRGRHSALTIALTPAQRRTLAAWQRASTQPARLVRRARIVLLRADGCAISTIARQVGMARHHIYKWLKQFQEHGEEGLQDKPGRGGARRTR